MNSDLKNAIAATSGTSQYDESVKRLLSQKEILANILVRTIPEFKGMQAKDVMCYIADGPYLGVPLDSGLTNAEKENGVGCRILGLNTENIDIKEGMIRFDILFYVSMKDGVTPMLINVEAQKSLPREYDIFKRAVFYASRLISSQKGREFVKSNYNDIRRVYSIWLCLNMDKNVMSHIHLSQDDLLDMYNWGSGIDLFNIILIGVTKQIPSYRPEYELHRLISVLTSMLLEDSAKIVIMGKEYDIDISNEMESEANTMCNLGEGIWEEAHEQGVEQGIGQGREKEQEQIVLRMFKEGCSPDTIVRFTGVELSKVRMILKSSKNI